MVHRISAICALPNVFQAVAAGGSWPRDFGGLDAAGEAFARRFWSSDFTLNDFE